MIWPAAASLVLAIAAPASLFVTALVHMLVAVLAFSFRWSPLPPWAVDILILSLPSVLMSASLALAFHAVKRSEQRTPGRTFSVASLCLSTALVAVYVGVWLFLERSP
ncbi:hypothetical protein [Arthrobacter sp. DR-2P]|nr:hypothetical protein [Arthrobacter sp. DR-2P]